MILSALILVSAAFAFHSGQILAGGTIGFQSSKLDSKSDASKQVEISPEISYFVHDLFAIDGTIGYAYSGDKNQNAAAIIIGTGVTFTQNQAYVGLGVQHINANIFISKGLLYSEDIKSKTSANHLNFKLGYLAPILERTFLDLRADYLMGVGSYGGDSSGSNKESGLSIRAGLKVVFR